MQNKKPKEKKRKGINNQEPTYNERRNLFNCYEIVNPEPRESNSRK